MDNKKIDIPNDSFTHITELSCPDSSNSNSIEPIKESFDSKSHIALQNDNKLDKIIKGGCSCCRAPDMFSFFNKKSKDLLCMDTFETNLGYDPNMISKPPPQKIIFSRKSNNN